MVQQLSEISAHLQPSYIRSLSKRCIEMGGINLGQGVCDIPTPAPIRQAAAEAMNANKNQYSSSQGLLEVREALAAKLCSYNRLPIRNSHQVMVSHGGTGAYVCALLTLMNPGDEIILFEPFYGYHRNIAELLGIVIKTVTIDLETYEIDQTELDAAISSKTKAMVICTPGNPSGKVFSQAELLSLGEFATKHNLYIITDEMYEYITYPGVEHVSPGALPGLFERTITLSGFSKTFNMTGWRLGYAAGPEEIIRRMSLLQDLIYVCPVTPLQHALTTALHFTVDYYAEMQASYLQKRDLMVAGLRDIGFKVKTPEGAYYLMLDLQQFNFRDDIDAADKILADCKVAVVPGRAFYLQAEAGQAYCRLCFAIERPHLEQALEQMQSLQHYLK